MLGIRCGWSLHPLRCMRAIHLISTLKPAANSTKSFKRLGRGASSNKGKTSGRGQKGQKARGKVKAWFEGGQTPIYKLFPKIGFTNVHARPLVPLNLERIVWFHRKGRLNLNEGEVLDMKKMRDAGVVTGKIKYGIKLLARGQFEFNLPWKVEASAASTKAIAAIERAGGSFVARYFSPMCLKAHLSPGWFIKRTGRVPLPARPIKRKYIDYYSNPDKRGYLIVENDPYYQRLQEAKRTGFSGAAKHAAKKSALERQLDKLTERGRSNQVHSTSKIVTFEEYSKGMV
ncbi:mitochondrial 54S ribosomal protein uL15m KNAG_0K02260 [Huiozyma naganishii CBS 8797]|uniref:Large ribosomal subunit protein uL15/eL18 domain-containing protein n=1 Tax=Huiozyma naganishii (strain ATCC MYA-139 / BCRC 22969 / CBS 8797 / KCTC 17520 / NBRC 10181 / NCYC 3082 / Yp74L-3) TaxID=1071383 RepID=J7SAA5_HUIN7|nr:hypothetical protein KNAG_0K02260 [Kazachstania naganishii CBS 8797]CCK72589.1 hypothetical protein KNAG_0K02260 [Kazachstania naganishii CBS 8797]